MEKVLQAQPNKYLEKQNKTKKQKKKSGNYSWETKHAADCGSSRALTRRERVGRTMEYEVFLGSWTLYMYYKFLRKAKTLQKILNL